MYKYYDSIHEDISTTTKTQIRAKVVAANIIHCTRYIVITHRIYNESLYNDFLDERKRILTDHETEIIKP